MRPVPRSGIGLSGTTVAGLVYTFGGVLDVDEDEENVLGNFGNEMHSLDLAKHVWRLVELRDASSAASAKKSGKKHAEAVEEATAATNTPAAGQTVSDDGVFKMVVGGGGGGSQSTSKVVADSKANDGNVPSPRMKASLVVCKKHLYLFGGIVEDGDKQITLADFYSLGEFRLAYDCERAWTLSITAILCSTDLTKLDKWKTIIGKEANTHEWMESDDDGSDSDDDDSDDDDSDDDDSDDDSDDMDTD